MLPQAATAFPRDRDSIEPGAEKGPAGAPADYQREYEAMREWSCQHRAESWLFFNGTCTWTCGDCGLRISNAALQGCRTPHLSLREWEA